MTHEIDFQYITKQDDLPATISNQLKTSFENYNINLSEDCLKHLTTVVTNVLKAVSKDNVVQTHGDFDIIKGFKQEFITPTDVQLLIQYDLYQQLERSNQLKNINYNCLKDISKNIMSSLMEFKVENQQYSKLKI